MSKRALLFVSPSGASVKTMRVPLWVIISALVMTAIGVASYFIPLDIFKVTDYEQAQARRLEELNTSLRNNIGATLKALGTLNERIARIESSKERYSDIVGLSSAGQPRQRVPQGSVSAVRLPPATALRHIGDNERVLAKFIASAGGGQRSVFDTIPVIRPVSPDMSVLSRHFGMDRDPFTGRQKMHYGTDFAAETGTPVVATAAGVVTKIENDPIWGRRITITHGRGFRTVYAHLGTVGVVQGRQVNRGDVIGTVGMSGLTTGVHVHYEIWHNDKAVNPEELLFPLQVAHR